MKRTSVVLGGHPDCGGTAAAVIAALPEEYPLGPNP
jgi:hypothetical protein